jgi:hypothetical protein
MHGARDAGGGRDLGFDHLAPRQPPPVFIAIDEWASRVRGRQAVSTHEARPSGDPMASV